MIYLFCALLGGLRDQRATYNEDFGGFTFTSFDGASMTV